ncbi:MAG: sensor histidine kinase [Acutalibacteraceae bacterium]
MDLIEDSFYRIKEIYSEDLNEVNAFGEKLQDAYGIKLMLTCEGEIVYSSGYANFKQNRENSEKAFLSDDIVFSYTPTTVIANMHKNNDGTLTLRLSGKFTYNYNDISVLMMLPMESIDNSVAFFTTTSAYISAVVLFIGIVAAILVSKNLAAPISTIDKVSKKIATLDFSYVADESVSTKELSSLAGSINEMSQKLQTTMEELQTANTKLKKDIDYQKQIEQLRRNFIASVSHEMKTPLSLLQIYTENLKNNVSDIDREYYYDTILEETDKLSEMVSHMLEISSVDSGFIQMKFERISLTELCKNMIQQYSPVFDKYQCEMNLQENINISGDAKYLEQSFKNLLNNAVQHTAEGGRIKVSLEKADGKAVFSVYNQGEPVPNEDIEHIWDAFYRADKSRTRTVYNNIGLGLSIVKTVTDKHEGTYQVKNVSDGVCFSITLNTIE